MIRIGITGHRILSKPDQIKTGISNVLSKITFGAINFFYVRNIYVKNDKNTNNSVILHCRKETLFLTFSYKNLAIERLNTANKK